MSNINQDNLTDVLSMALALKLTKTPLFSQLDEDELKIVASVLKPIHAKKEEHIFLEGDTGKAMFILFSGTLNAFGAQSDGTQRWLFDIQQGDFFGEMSIIAQEPRSATISAKEDSVVMTLSAVDFYRIISDHPIIGFKLLRAISVVQNRWLDQTSKSFSDLTRWGETARRRAITDEMTGLYNRRYLEDYIKEHFNNQSMNLRIMALLMMDLDRIHGINDQHGTKAGDTVIITAADMIRLCLRPGDIPARLSGDEFAVILPDTDLRHAVKVAEQIRKTIGKQQIEVPLSPGSDETVLIGTYTSIGIAIAPVNGNTMEEFEKNADIALRKAKEMGRNRVEVYS